MTVCPDCRGYLGLAITGIALLDCACARVEDAVPSTYPCTQPGIEGYQHAENMATAAMEIQHQISVYFAQLLGDQA